MKCPKCGSNGALTERRPNGDSSCFHCQYKGPTIEFKEPMKTKKIEIERWITFHKDNPSGPSIAIYSQELNVDKDYACVPCTITFEIPIPEPSVSITLSRLEAAWDKVLAHKFGIKAEDSQYFDEFKEALFRDGSRG